MLTKGRCLERQGNLEESLTYFEEAFKVFNVGGSGATKIQGGHVPGGVSGGGR
jgi:hypothetical protein